MFRLIETPLQVMPDDHSKLVPPLPIPNRTVKQLCADDSAATSVKVGYRQACYMQKPLGFVLGAFCFSAENSIFCKRLLQRTLNALAALQRCQ